MLRALFIAAFFFTITPLLVSLQWLLGKLKLPGWGFIASNYYRTLCRLLRIRVRVNGEPVRARPVLFVSNHVSWVDIVVIGSIAPVAFVAKREVASWPLVGFTAKMQRTVFVDRTRRLQTAEANDEIARRLTEGDPVVLFAEGTSSDGNHVLEFRSALIGAVTHLETNQQVMLQPVSIAYTRTQGIAMGRQHRPLVAWYGDIEFAPHFKRFLDRCAVDVVVTFGQPVPFDHSIDRKTVARTFENKVRKLMAAALRDRAVETVT